MPILRAEDRLREGNVGDTELYDVALLATGSEEIASDILYERYKARLDRGETPEV